MKIPFTLWRNILNFKKVKYIYIWFGLVFESLAHDVNMPVCSFFPKKFKLVLQKILYENSFYSLEEYFAFQRI